MELNTYEKFDSRYRSLTKIESIRSWNTYKNVRNLKYLHTVKQFKSILRKVWATNTLQESSELIEIVFEIVFADEIQLKSGVQYQGGHLIHFSVDKPDKNQLRLV